METGRAEYNIDELIKKYNYFNISTRIFQDWLII